MCCGISVLLFTIVTRLTVQPRYYSAGNSETPAGTDKEHDSADNCQYNQNDSQWNTQLVYLRHHLLLIFFKLPTQFTCKQQHIYLVFRSLVIVGQHSDRASIVSWVQASRRRQHIMKQSFTSNYLPVYVAEVKQWS